MLKFSPIDKERMHYDDVLTSILPINSHSYFMAKPSKSARPVYPGPDSKHKAVNNFYDYLPSVPILTIIQRKAFIPM